MPRNRSWNRARKCCTFLCTQQTMIDAIEYGQNVCDVVYCTLWTVLSFVTDDRKFTKTFSRTKNLSLRFIHTRYSHGCVCAFDLLCVDLLFSGVTHLQNSKTMNHIHTSIDLIDQKFIIYVRKCIFDDFAMRLSFCLFSQLS